MSVRYAALPAGARICRMVKKPGGHWPSDAALPLASMLQPTREDVAEGVRSGRGPGLSVFDQACYKHEVACWVRSDDVYQGRSSWKSCVAGVDDLHKLSPFGRALFVVSDPLDAPDRSPPEPWSAADIAQVASSHALVEGIAAPPEKIPGEPRPERTHKIQKYNDGLQHILDVFRPWLEAR